MEVIDKDGSVIAEIGNGGLTITPHPLTRDGQRYVPSDLVPGESLLLFLKRHEPTIDSGAWSVTINGHMVPHPMWVKTFPKPGTLVECRSIVRKDVLRIAAVFALAVFAPAIGMALAGAVTMTPMAMAIALAVTVVGSVIINKLLGPKPPIAGKQPKESPTYSLSGGRNRARPYEPIGLLLGELRITPDYAALPYVWFEGDNQFMYCVFHGGINCASFSSLRIGKTPIESYKEVTTRTAGFSGMTEETLDRWTNVDTITGGTLEGSTTVEEIPSIPEQTFPGPWVTRTTSFNTTVIQCDFEGSLYRMLDDGSLLSDYGTVITGEYRSLPSGDWLPFIDGQRAFGINNASTKPVRRTYTRTVSQGQYEVRWRKEWPNVDSSREASVIHWMTLKSVQPDTGNYGGMGRLGLKIRATGQLTGAIDEINWLALAKPMPYWNGSTWTTATARANGISNPGAQFLLFARGIYNTAGNLSAGLGLADSRIDIESLKGFMVHCATRGFTFDHWFDSALSCDELLEVIAAAGMGTKTWNSGKLGVVWVADDQPIEGVVNMATMKARTFNVNYQTVETADGIEYQYFDRDRDFTWKSIRVAAPGVTTVVNPARIQSVGITTEAHASVMARFHLAQSVYQRKDISYEADLEYLTYTRFSVMALSHDVTQWGYGGRLQSVVNNGGILTLTLDESVPAGTGLRYIGLRIPGDKGYRVFSVAAFTGESRTVTLGEAWPANVAIPGSSPSNPAQDTIWVYDFKSTPGYKVRVISIQPQSNLAGATVSVVPESPEFWDYVLNGAYTPPPNQSLLPGRPVASRPQITEELQRQGNTYYVELSLAFDVVGSYGRAEIWGSTAGNPLSRMGTTQTLRFEWRGKLNDVWTIEVRPFDGLGRPGNSVGATYTVAGLSAPPSDVAGFTAQLTGDRVLLTWNRSTDVDFNEYELRFGTSWETAAFVARVKTTGHKVQPLGAGTYTWLIKAIDSSGNGSANSAIATVTISGPVAPTVNAQVVAAQAALTWTEPASAFFIAGYEVRYGDAWDTATFVTQLQARTIALDIDWGGARRFWIAAYDIAGNMGTPGSAILSLNALSQPTVTAQVIDNNVLLSWTASTGSLPVKHYEIRKGSTPASSTSIGTLQGQFSAIFESTGGAYTYWVVPVDTANQAGTAGSTVATVSQPPDFRLLYDQNSAFAGRRSNAVLEGGALLVPFKAPTHHFEFDSGVEGWTGSNATVSAASGLLTLTASANDPKLVRTFSPLEQFKGSLATKVFIRARRITGSGAWEGNVYYTTAGHGHSSSFYKSIPAPADMNAWNTFEADMTALTAGGSDWVNSEITDIRIDFSNDAATNWQVESIAVGGETYEGHFTSIGWGSPQDQIIAGYPYYAQPTVSTAQYEEVIDYGTTVPSTNITITVQKTDVVAGVTVTPKISVSNSSATGPWTDFNGVYQAFASSFRWIKIRLDFTGATATALTRITQVNVRLALKTRTDSGKGTGSAADVGGTQVNFNENFVDVESITVSPLTTVPVFAGYNFVDAPNPTGFKALFWDTSGVRVNCPFSWQAKGV